MIEPKELKWPPTVVGGHFMFQGAIRAAIGHLCPAARWSQADLPRWTKDAPQFPICHPERAKWVEGSSHLWDICSQIGAKILRLRASPSAQDDRYLVHRFFHDNDRGIRATKRGRKNPTQHSYHITLSFSSQRENAPRSAKSVPCTKTVVCIWETFRLEKLEKPCYSIGTKRRYQNGRTSGGLPKAKVNQGNQSDFKSK